MKRYLPLAIVVLVGVLAVAGGTRLYWIKRPHILTISSEHRSKAGADESVTFATLGTPHLLKVLRDPRIVYELGCRYRETVREKGVAELVAWKEESRS